MDVHHPLPTSLKFHNRNVEYLFDFFHVEFGEGAALAAVGV